VCPGPLLSFTSVLSHDQSNSRRFTKREIGVSQDILKDLEEKYEKISKELAESVRRKDLNTARGRLDQLEGNLREQTRIKDDRAKQKP